MTNFEIVLFLIIFEACYEGFKIRKWHIASEFVELIYLGIITFILLGWANGYLPQRPVNTDFWFVFFGYVLFRYAVFDFVFNIFARQPLFYIGYTKLFDKILSNLSEKTQGWFVVITKLLAFGIGLSWVCGWRYGILG